MIIPSGLGFKNGKTLPLFGALGVAVVLGSVALLYRAKVPSMVPALTEIAARREPLTKDKLREALGTNVAFYKFPSEIEIPGKAEKGIVQYAFDPKLQSAMEDLFQTYKPDYGAFVAMDATTGQILSLVSYSTDNKMQDNLALRATFPSASIFKVVTAAAALENQKLEPNSVIPFNGANHTLYRGNVLNPKQTRWTRYTTLKDAFAKSINTVFGRIGAYTVGPAQMTEYADRFGFNRQIMSDLPVQQGRAMITNDSWNLAQAASGYTRDNTMSPLQGAMIAAAVVNQGVVMEPYLVQSVFTQEGGEMYAAQPKVSRVVLDPKTAEEMKVLMRETVVRGTSKKSFRGFFQGSMAEFDVGGKTGSLTGMDPPGKYDWFVGFAEGKNRRIAVAALTVHGKMWRVKSSYLARRAIESYFHPESFSRK